MTQTALQPTAQPVPTKTPADLLHETVLLLNGHVPRIYHGQDVVSLPAIQAESDGVSLTVRCGGRVATFSLQDDLLLDDPVLIGEGGYVLPTYLPERWRLLAAVLPMEEKSVWPVFDLTALAQRLGYRVLHSDVVIRFKHVCTLHLLRLEHQEKGVVWGCVSTEDNCDGVIDDVLILGGVPVARYRVEATHDDHALAGMSDADLREEGLTRPGAEVFRNVGTPLTSERLQHVLNAVESNTVQFLTGEGI